MIPFRTVQPEWLDVLSVTDSRSIHSRRDLRRVNQCMFNVRIVAKLLTPNLPCRILEIGAGDGTFMLALAHLVSNRNEPVHITLLDRLESFDGKTCDAFASLGWTARTVISDVFEFLDTCAANSFDLVVCNLFLHHFQDDELRRLFQLLREKAGKIVACEPRRSSVALVASRLLRLIGCNDVTLHDATVSVLAGFSHKELSSLWCQNPEWMLTERRGGLFSHCFVARRTI